MAYVEEFAVEGDRIYYKLLRHNGDDAGWHSDEEVEEDPPYAEENKEEAVQETEEERLAREEEEKRVQEYAERYVPGRRRAFMELCKRDRFAFVRRLLRCVPRSRLAGVANKNGQDRFHRQVSSRESCLGKWIQGATG